MSNRQEGDPDLPGERDAVEDLPGERDDLPDERDEEGPPGDRTAGRPAAADRGGDAEGSTPEMTLDAGDPGELPAPRPGLSPEKVLKRVLSALADNDDPFENAGIRTAFNFASPTFRSQTGGSLQAFAAFLTDPIHRALVGHADNSRGRLRTDDAEPEATEKVVVTDADGEDSTYEFTLRRQSGGKYDDCWMLEGIELVYVGAAPDHQHMPTVEFGGVEVKCKEGEILRDVLLRASGVSPYNSAAQYANCNGKGLCGTCAVEVVDGEVTEKTAQEKRRLRLPPHDGNDDPNFRLSCQARVLSDLVVTKHDGVWGQHVEEYARDSEEEAGGDPIRVTDEEYLGAGDATPEPPREEEDPEEMDLSEEAQNLLEETERMLDDDRDE